MNLKRHANKPPISRYMQHESRIDRIERNLIEDMLAGSQWERRVKGELNELYGRTRGSQVYNI